MPKKRPITVDDLWKLDRVGAVSLAPDGAQAVAAVTRSSMAENKTSASLWLLSTLGGAPRALTHCGEKDGQPRWSPHLVGGGRGGKRGGKQVHNPSGREWIGFIAKREQEGKKDDEPQFYVIAPDGGEARRIGHVATGVMAFRWFPDGRRIALVSWVWPELKGAEAQAKQHKAFKERKETAYATSEGFYRHWDHNLPMGRVAHLLVLDVDSGKLTDLFEGSDLELYRREPGADCFDISPDGRHIVFAHDPAAEQRSDARLALSEIEVRTRCVRSLVRDAAWNFEAPRYSPKCGPEGDRIAFVASHQGLKHTMPDQLAVLDLSDHSWDVVSAEWDHAVHAPLLWEDDGLALLFTAEQQGRTHLWRFDLSDRRAEMVVAGGGVTGFDKRAGTLLSVADAALHPARVHAHLPGGATRRVENFNDKLLASLDLGIVEEHWIEGAQGDRVQMWLHHPPGFDKGKKYPLMQLIHGGPHTAFGDSWHYRWNMATFAAQGYLVAAVNYHGSSGFGYAFLDSITHRWGALELQDVEAATDLLLKKPWVDRKRVYATGGSYGGFMVAWMNGHVRHGRYAAYICHAGCFDWTAMFADDAWSWHAQELGAWYWDQPAQVNSQSPHAFAAAMKTPTLVIHGALDYRVPDAQGLAYFNTLKALGVDARLLWFPDENHWVLKPRNSQLWYAEFFAWLRGHGGAGKVRSRRSADT